ncbi:MAG: right-handed parallel beta-helix repeat-containing protein [Pseudomonadota bacterium]
MFEKGARLSIDLSSMPLAAGTRKSSLRLALLEDGRWSIIQASGVDPSTGKLTAQIEHFSIYGIVAEPELVSDRNSHFEANGVTARTNATVSGRLLVSSSFVSFYAELDADDAVDLTFSGLPTDAEHHIYVNSHEDHYVLGPSDGGIITIPLDLAHPALVWIQPGEGTIIIGGEKDECETYGERAGGVCTLTMDLVADVELLAGTLDCNGHSITQPEAYGGMGIGVLIRPVTAGATVENCTIGSETGYFAYGIEALGMDTSVISNNTLMDNLVGILLQGATDSFVTENEVTGGSYWAIALWDSSSGNEVADNLVDVDHDAITIEGLDGDPLSATENRIIDNAVTRGMGGILLATGRGNLVRGNDISGVGRCLGIATDGWPNTVYWNNFSEWSTWGVWSDTGPAEISYGTSYGNWWGHACPGPLFTPEVDSNSRHVRDSRAYGERDAWLAGISPGCPGDADGDGVGDSEDNCPDITNPDQFEVCDILPPDAPLITFPGNGDCLADPRPLITGVAEAGSLVQIIDCGARVYFDEGFWDGCAALGQVLSFDDGSFSLYPNANLAERIHNLAATATDAVGNVSAISTIVAITIDTIPPGPPLITSPAQGEIAGELYPQIRGIAEPEASIVVFDYGVPIGEASSDEFGIFALAPTGSVSEGEHVLTARAIDCAGNFSQLSDPVAFDVFVISESSPVVGFNGKVKIIGVEDSLDPFDPRVETSKLTVDFEAAAVKGLGGNSKNHEFRAAAEWAISRATTGQLTRTIDGEVVIAAAPGTGGSPIRENIMLEWDGKEEDGQDAAFGETFPYGVTLNLVRLYVGGGRGPQCSRGESVVLTKEGSPACLIDSVSLDPAGSVGTITPAVKRLDVNVSPEAITPDGNSIFDFARIDADVLIDKPLLECSLFKQELTWLLYLDVSVVGSSGEAVRSFQRMKPLDVGECADPIGPVPFAFTWDGKSADGSVVAEGSYAVKAEASLVEISNKLLSGRKVETIKKQGPSITTGFTHGTKELQWQDVESQKGVIGARDEIAEGQHPLKYESATPATIDDLYSKWLLAAGVDLPAEFDKLLAKVIQDAAIDILPSQAQIEKWRDLYIGSHGRVNVTWSNAGVPASITGLDSGAMTGEDVEAADRYLEEQQSSIQVLFNLQPGERMVLGKVAPNAYGKSTYVQYVHEYSPDPDGAGGWYRVAGDRLVVHVDHDDEPTASKRIDMIHADWNQLTAFPSPFLTQVEAENIAILESGIGDVERVSSEGPYLMFIEPGNGVLLYEVLVSGIGSARKIYVNCVDGSIVANVDGIVRGRVTFDFNPFTPQTAVNHGECAGGVPDAKVCLAGFGAPDECVETDVQGYYDEAPLEAWGCGPWPARGCNVILEGEYISEYTLGKNFIPSTEEPYFGLHNGFFHRIDTPSGGHIVLRQVQGPDLVDLDTIDFITGTLFAHMNYQQHLYRQSGLIDGGPVHLEIDWQPKGYMYPCDEDSDCGGCDTSTHFCQMDNTRDFSEDSAVKNVPGDGDGRRCSSNDECEFYPIRDSRLNFFCNTIFPGDPDHAGTCDWVSPDRGGIGDYSDPLTSELIANNISIASSRLLCEDFPGCPYVRDSAERLGFLDVRDHAEYEGIFIISHELMHYILGKEGFFSGTGGHGTLAGFASETIPSFVPLFLYPESYMFMNRIGDANFDFGPTFGGDPLSGMDDCATNAADGETDDPWDFYACQTQIMDGAVAIDAPTCREDRCYVYDPAYEACCAAGNCSDVFGNPSGFPVICEFSADTGRHYGFRIVDVHENGEWLGSILTKHSLQTGKRLGLNRFARLLDGFSVRDSTRVYRGANSLLNGVTRPDARTAAAFEGSKAFDMNVTADFDYTDEASNMMYHGDILDSAGWSMQGITFTGRIDSQDDVDQRSLYLYAGETYEVTLDSVAARGDFYLALFKDLDNSADPCLPRGWTWAPTIPGTPGGYGSGTIRPVADGFYSIQVGANIYSSSAADYSVIISSEDDYPDLPEQAVALPQNISPAYRIYGELGSGSTDVDQFRAYLPMGSRSTFIIENLSNPYRPSPDPVAKVFFPFIRWEDGEPEIIEKERECTFVGGLCNVSFDPSTYIAGYYRLEISNEGTERRIGYRFRVESADGPDCSRDYSSTHAYQDKCRLDRHPLFAATMVDAWDVDHLWFYGTRNHIYTLSPVGNIRVSVHHPTYLDRDDREYEGTSLNPIFSMNHDPQGWFGDVSYVAPMDGWYRVTVAGAAPSYPANYAVSLFSSRWTACDMESISDVFDAVCAY